MDIRSEIERLRLVQKQQEEDMEYLTNINVELLMKIDSVKREIKKEWAKNEMTNFRIAQARKQMEKYRKEFNEASALDEVENDEDAVEKTENEIQQLCAILKQKENAIKSITEDIAKIKADCISIEKDRIEKQGEKMKKIEELRQKLKEKNRNQK